MIFLSNALFAENLAEESSSDAKSPTHESIKRGAEIIRRGLNEDRAKSAGTKPRSDAEIGKSFSEIGIYKLSSGVSDSFSPSATKEEREIAILISEEFYRKPLWDTEYRSLKKDQEALINAIDNELKKLELELEKQSNSHVRYSQTRDQILALTRRRVEKLEEISLEFSELLTNFSQHLSETLRVNNEKKPAEYWYDFTERAFFPGRIAQVKLPE